MPRRLRIEDGAQKLHEVSVRGPAPSASRTDADERVICTFWRPRGMKATTVSTDAPIGNDYLTVSRRIGPPLVWVPTTPEPVAAMKVRSGRTRFVHGVRTL